MAPKVMVGQGRVWHLGHLPFALPSPGGGPLRLQHRPMGNTVEPVPHHVPGPHCPGLADEHEESSLKRILGILSVQPAAADSPDHRPVPLHQGGKGNIVPAFDKGTEEFPVGPRTRVRHLDGSLKVLHDSAGWVTRHLFPRTI
jgi:hypothetical protein